MIAESVGAGFICTWSSLMLPAATIPETVGFAMAAELFATTGQLLEGLSRRSQLSG